MKVSSRLGDLSGCTVWGSPHPAPLSGLLPGLPRPADSAEPADRPACGPGSPGKVRGGGAVAASRAQAGRVTWAPGREAAAQPWPSLAWAVSESFLITGVN